MNFVMVLSYCNSRFNLGSCLFVFVALKKWPTMFFGEVLFGGTDILDLWAYANLNQIRSFCQFSAFLFPLCIFSIGAHFAFSYFLNISNLLAKSFFPLDEFLFYFFFLRAAPELELRDVSLTEPNAGFDWFVFTIGYKYILRREQIFKLLLESELRRHRNL